jgi:hypothetical protein
LTDSSNLSASILNNAKASVRISAFLDISHPAACVKLITASVNQFVIFSIDAQLRKSTSCAFAISNAHHATHFHNLFACSSNAHNCSVVKTQTD